MSVGVREAATVLTLGISSCLPARLEGIRCSRAAVPNPVCRGGV